MTTPDAVTAQVGLVITAVDYLAGFEDQSRTLLVDMSQAMLGDVTGGQGLRPLTEYIRRYCDFIGSAAEADRIAAEIETQTGSEDSE